MWHVHGRGNVGQHSSVSPSLHGEGDRRVAEDVEVGRPSSEALLLDSLATAVPSSTLLSL